MRNAPSNNILTERVTITLQTYGQDADGFRIVTGIAAVIPNVRCQVVSSDPKREATVGPDGFERITTYIEHHLEFISDNGEQVDDLIAWNDGFRAHTMIIAGVSTLGGGGPLKVVAHERI